jgi:hypothetical protein
MLKVTRVIVNVEAIFLRLFLASRVEMAGAGTLTQTAAESTLSGQIATLAHSPPADCPQQFR